MKRRMCKSKVHRATVTDADLNYEGSLTIDGALMDAANILEYEQVVVVNVSNGQRFETYAMRGADNSGAMVVNGAAARLVHRGDLIIVLTYADYDEAELASFHPTFVFVDGNNRIKELTDASPH
jgi:aspartate 1-decarboxylase